MRLYLLIIGCLLLLVDTSMGQSRPDQQLADKSPELVEQISEQPLPNTSRLATPFAEPQLLNPEQAEDLRNASITRVKLIYTTFRESADFNQQNLNQERLSNLRKLVPEWFESPFVRWELVGQTACEDAESGDSFFHGFEVTYRPLSSAALIEKDLDELREAYEELTRTPDPSSGSNGSSSQSQQNWDPSVVHPSGGPTSSNNPTAANYDPADPNAVKPPFEIKTRWDDRIGYVHDTIWHTKPKPISNKTSKKQGQDSLLFSVLNRHPEWENRLFVADVTCSMSPYSKQIFQWFRQQNIEPDEDKEQHFVFFNDGDGKRDRVKRPGETGGIYTLTNPDLKTIFQTMVKATSRCTNNDHAENDAEALLEAQDLCKDCTEMVLIADNYSNIRDKQLLYKLQKPVHVVLCGVNRSINPQYLELARKTRGSVHTMADDIEDFQNIVEGDTITLNGMVYKLTGGKFIPQLTW